MQKICSAPWNTVAVVPGGDVYSCLCGAWTDRVIGNLRNNSLHQIYASSVFLKELRDSVDNGSYKFCNANMCPNVHNLDNTPVGKYKHEIPNLELPTTIMLGIDSNCNLKCPSCRNERVFSKSVDPTVWNILESLQNCYQEFEHTVQLFCDGAGDLFTSEAYNQFLFNGNLPKCFQLFITTNGNLVAKKIEKITQLRDQIKSFIISLDAATPETYSITRGGDFDIVLRGVQLLKQAGIKTNFQFVLQQSNCHELLAYKALANRLEVPYGVQLLHRWDHMSDQYWNENKIQNNPKVNLETVQSHLQILKKDPTCTFNGGVISIMDRII